MTSDINQIYFVNFNYLLWLKERASTFFQRIKEKISIAKPQFHFNGKFNNSFSLSPPICSPLFLSQFLRNKICWTIGVSGPKCITVCQSLCMTLRVTFLIVDVILVTYSPRFPVRYTLHNV